MLDINTLTLVGLVKGLLILRALALSGFELGVKTVPNLIRRAMKLTRPTNDITGIHQLVYKRYRHK